MTVKTKLLIAFLLLAAVSLACASLNTFLEEPQAPSAPAANTPLPALPTNTPEPPPTDPAPPTEEPSSPPAEFGEALYADDFSDPASGWDQYSYDEASADYQDGQYKITVNSDLLNAWANPGQEFNDTAIEVIVTKNTGEDDNQFGIICRYQDVDHFYALLITADGYSAIRKKTLEANSEGTNFLYLADWIESPVINQGNATNLLRAECVGDRLTLYVNGVLLLEVFDPDFKTGDVGLLAGSFSAPKTEILFDNFVVTAP